MALSTNKPRRVPESLTLIVLCLLSIAILTVWVREGDSGLLHQARAAFGVITAPFQSAGFLSTTPIRAIGEASENGRADEATLLELRAENEELRSEVIRLEEYRQESERLTSLLELRDVYNLETVGARIISWSADSWNRVITINKGSVAGLTVGMPVMSANGLIGQIESVSPNSSTVRLITDERSGVAVFLQESRAEGILAGSYDGLLYLQFIPMDVSVEPGDSIVTSGAGGVYPKGIPVGEVSTVSAMPSDVYQTIVVRPITRVTDYEEVLVLIGNESEIVPNKEAAAAAQAATAAEAETDATKEEEAETEGGQ